MSATENTKTAGCQPFAGPNMIPGWICCRCRTYNGNTRPQCKHCQHNRCNTPPREPARYGCGFCAGWYSIVGDADGVGHSEPTCEPFRLLDADHFAIACRLAWQQLRGQLPPQIAASATAAGNAPPTVQEGA